VHVVARALEQPAPDRLGLARRSVVEHQVHLEVGRDRHVDGAEEVPELDAAVPAMRRGDDAPARHVQRREKVRGAGPHGDTPYDVQAARAAGVGCVALRSGGWTDEHFGDALTVYDNPADLLAHYETSPFARPLRPAAATA
jgi:hypothetical protein